MDFVYVAWPASSSPGEPVHASEDQFKDSGVFIQPSETTTKKAIQEISFDSVSDVGVEDADGFADPSFEADEEDALVLVEQTHNFTEGISTPEGDGILDGSA